MRISAAERKQQLINATVDLMRTRGVQALTLRAIAEHAHAPLATVHYCFHDKDELVAAAVDYWLRLMVDDMSNDAGGAGGLRATVHRLGARFWEGLEQNSQDVLAQLEVITWAMREQPTSGLAGLIYSRYETELALLFAKALADAGEEASIPVEQLARAFLVAIDGCSLQALADPAGSHYRAVFSQLVDGLLSNTVRSGLPADEEK